MRHKHGYRTADSHAMDNGKQGVGNDVSVCKNGSHIFVYHVSRLALEKVIESV